MSNHKTQNSIKLFVAGLPNAGKSTFVKTCSEISPVETEVKEISGRETTIAMDFGVITLPNKYKLFVYGLPGQKRFSFMWDILSGGAIGFVYLVSSLKEIKAADLENYRNIKKIANIPHVIAITKVDLIDDFSKKITEIKNTLEVEGNTPILNCNNKKRKDVKLVLEELISHIISSLE